MASEIMQDQPASSSWAPAASQSAIDGQRGSESYTAVSNNDIGNATVLNGAGSEDDMGLRAGSGIQPNLLPAFEAAAYHTYGLQYAGQHGLDSLENYLARELPASQHPETIAHSARQYKRNLTVEEMLLTYRAAYWKMKPWQEHDTIQLERAVKEECETIWDRVAHRMHKNGCPQWPPHELRMRYCQHQQHQANAMLRLS